MSSRITILGPGLLGGSLALALRARTGARVTLWARREEAVREVIESGCADAATSDLAEAVKDADAVVFATPVGVMRTIAEKIAPHLQPHCLVMDVGSVKRSVVEELGPVFAARARFVGCHPMAGSEQTGLAAARVNLFESAVCIVTPMADTPDEDTEAASDFWQGVGCHLLRLSPEQHDLHVGFVSHLPHLLAAVLVNTVASHEPEAFRICGPGFRDTTRVASGPPGMWTEIIGQNREAIRQALDGLIEKLRGVSTLLSGAPSPDTDSLMNQLLTQAKAQRDTLRLPRNSSDA